jgi:hypothetical protein
VTSPVWNPRCEGLKLPFPKGDVEWPIVVIKKKDMMGSSALRSHHAATAVRCKGRIRSFLLSIIGSWVHLLIGTNSRQATRPVRLVIDWERTLGLWPGPKHWKYSGADFVILSEPSFQALHEAVFSSESIIHPHHRFLNPTSFDYWNRRELPHIDAMSQIESMHGTTGLLCIAHPRYAYNYHQ